MRWLPVATAWLIVAAGCNSTQLRYDTLRLAATVPDLQERQVLDNLIRTATMPGSLPYFAVVDAGTANVTDTGSGSLSFTGVADHYTSGTYGTSGSRQITGNWSLKPLVNPDRLAAMRAAYQMVINPSAVNPRDMTKLRAALGADPGFSVPTGWLGVGCKRDVPCEASIVAHTGRTYVWVMPDRVSDFTDFVLTILNIATVSAPAPPARPSGVPPTAALPEAVPPTPATAPSPFAPRLYDDTWGINRGLFFVPR
jgi:hypothetical protein